MNFGDAIEELKKGKKICRAGWNGKNMHLYRVLPNVTDDGYEEQSFIMMKTAQDTLVPWTCSQSDVFAEDWTIL